MAGKKKVKRLLEKISFHIEFLLEVSTSGFGKILQRLWQITLGSNLHKKDKAEILRLLIFAAVVITMIINSRP